jgi:hypothetical protein
LHASEVHSLHGTKQSASAAVQKLQSNADPDVAQLRSYAADVASGAGEAAAAFADLRAEAEQLAAAAGLQSSEARAGKQGRCRAGRNPDRVVKPLRSEAACGPAANE